ncbi:MAG: GtrA family protein [Treponema sp.]|jgi:putative flippase GtrA|nr:GtrA family protein [Treponema sp.]
MLLDRIFFKFILVGFINTLAGGVLMFALYNCAGWTYWAASAANYIAGSILSFFLNKYFTFKIRQWSVKMAALFALTIAVSYLLAYGFARPLLRLFTRAYWPEAGDNPALFAGMCFFTLLNYLGQRFVVFKKH